MRKYVLVVASFFCLLFTLSGCMEMERDFVGPSCTVDCTVIKGRFTTANGKAPIANLDVMASWVNIPFLGGLIRKKALTKTDANGNYELRILVRDDELEEGHYQVKVADPKSGMPYQQSLNNLLFPVSGHNFSYHALVRDTVYEVNYQIPLKAYIELRVTNPEQIKPSDYFTTSFEFNMGINNKLKYLQHVTWSAMPLKPVFEVAAEQPITVQTMKTKNGIKTVTYDTIFLKPGQKLVYTATF